MAVSDISSKARVVGLAMAIAGAVAFSGKAIIVKLAYRYGVDAATLIMLRMAFALPLFLAMVWWTSRAGAGGVRPKPLETKDWLAVFGLGFSGYYLASYLDFLGLQYISASLERLILYLNPTLVLLLGWLLFKRRITRVQMGAMALSYMGVVLVFGQEARLEGANVALGAALVFASAVSYAVYLVYSGEYVKRLGSLRLVGLASSVACLLCIAQFLVLRPISTLATLAPEVFTLSIFNAVFCTAVPVVLVMMAIERVGASLASQAGMVGPMSTILLGVWLLDEPFTTSVLFGTLLVLAGVWWVGRSR
jgi:drug/metabolite transporter (DMT)-like permease